MERIIGTFNRIDHSTYAECARITLWERCEYGKYRATTDDGILYLWTGVMNDAGGMDYTIIGAYSTFDLNVLQINQD